MQISNEEIEVTIIFKVNLKVNFLIFTKYEIQQTKNEIIYR